MIGVLSNLPQDLLFKIGLIIILASIVGYIAKIFRQPLIPAYIITGLILGPIGLGLVQDISVIRSISEIGIVFLLFIVGLEIDLKKLKTVGSVTIVTALLQVLLTFLAGYFVALKLGFDTSNAVYAGLIVAFSSTMIVIKLLFDEDELNTLHGRILIGVLFIQDILVILALTMLVGAGAFSPAAILPSIGKFLLLVAGAYIMNRFIAYPLFKFAAKSSELLFLLSLAVCFIFALAAYFLNFSIAIGAFFGGITLANLPYNWNIIARITSLKDFFATIFFVSLGLQLVIPDFQTIFTPLFFFLAIVILLKPLIVMITLSLYGYDKRNAFVSSVSLAQISEFGLILALSAPNISQELFSITILLGVITIGLTAYIMKYELAVYNRISGILSIFEKLTKQKKQLGYEYKDHPHVILFGANRVGGTYLKSYKHFKNKTLVIDYNPEIIEGLKKEKISCMYGDMSNLEILRRINFKEAKVVISTIARESDNLALLGYIKDIRSNALIIMTAANSEQALTLYEKGADYVLVPAVKTGEIISSLLEKYMDKKKLLQKLKQTHIKNLQSSNKEKS